MKRLVKIHLSQRNYRKLLLLTKTAGYKSVQALMTATIKEIPLKVSCHSLYTCWINMRERCLRPSHPDFKHYGGRGIKICDSWLDERFGFEHFLLDLPVRVEQKNSAGRSVFTLDRIDNDGHYEPNNIKWSTWEEQFKNRRKPKKAKKPTP
jgi:hypothetical protein